MSDELTKLADYILFSTPRKDLVARIVQSHHAAERAKAALLVVAREYCEGDRGVETIAALDALILTPPVDPLLVEARKAAASVYPTSHNSYLILQGQRDGTDIVQSALAALRRGLELRTSADGGAA